MSPLQPVIETLASEISAWASERRKLLRELEHTPQDEPRRTVIEYPAETTREAIVRKLGMCAPRIKVLCAALSAACEAATWEGIK